MTSQSDPPDAPDPRTTVERIDAALTEAGMATAPVDLDDRPAPDRGPHPDDGDGGSSDHPKVSRADAAFKRLTQAAGVGLLLLIVAIALFLVLKATGALSANKGDFLTTFEWTPNNSPPVFGIAALLFGTIITAIIAMIIAVPVAVGIALYLTHYAPKQLATPMSYLVDLLAAVPSVVYGLWGLYVLVPHALKMQQFLNVHLGWIPLFSAAGGTVGRSVLIASILLGIMILPIVASISREIFVQVPNMHKEAALALGATRWEMIRTAVLPYSRPGIISASMLGLGRAMGETIAVAIVLPATFGISGHILEPAGNTIAANVANEFGEANTIGRGALIASGLVLFIVTMLVNIAARTIIARRKEFSGASG